MYKHYGSKPKEKAFNSAILPITTGPEYTPQRGWAPKDDQSSATGKKNKAEAAA